MIEIKDRFTARVIYSSDKATTVKEALLEAIQQRADLSGAYLSGAYLSGADLSRADLSGAIGYNRYLTEPLLSLYDQPGQIVMYKLVTADGTGPTYPGIQYEIGKTIRVAKKLVQTNDEIDCGAGVNVATLPWVLQHWTKGQRVLTVSFTADDIASIPINSDGKLRLFKCKVEAELDLVAMKFIDADGNRI